MTTNVLLIDDSGGPYLLDTIRCLAYQQAVHIYVVSPEEKSYFNTIPFSRYVKKYQHLDYNQQDELLDQIKLKINQWNIDVVLPAKQSNILFFANLNGEFNKALLPPISNLNTIQSVSDKYLLYQWLKQNLFPTPSSYELPLKNINSITYPVLLKPRLDTNEKRFDLLQNENQLHELLSEPDFNCENFILQEYIKGEDIDISFLADKGEVKAYTIQKGLTRETFSFASGIEFIHNKALLILTKQIVAKLNWSGIAHLDFVYHAPSNSYYLIDFNSRLWSTILGSLYAGVNFPLLMTKLALNQDINFTGYKTTPFFLAKSALQKENISKIRHSIWRYIIHDPLPELAKGIHKTLSFIRKKDRR